MQNLTILIKTFNRPWCLARLLNSVGQYYPELPIVIVDDSSGSKEMVVLNGKITYIKTPYDIGLSAGRNLGLNHINTKYTILCDDDFEFFEETNFNYFLESIEKGFDIVGGVFLETWGIRHFEGTLNLEDNCLYAKKENKGFIDGIPRFDFVHNFFIGRTNKLKLFPWDGELKVGEHIDFFFRFKDKLTVGYDERVKIRHVSANNPDYMSFRTRAYYYIGRMVRKLGLNKFVDFYGRQFIDTDRSKVDLTQFKQCNELFDNLYMVSND